MGVKLSEIITASRFTTGTGGKLSDAADTLNNTAFSDFQVNIPSITVGLGTSTTSGINISSSAELDGDTTYYIYVGGLSSVGNSMFRNAVIRNGNNWNVNLSGGQNLSELSTPSFQNGDLRLGSFNTGSSSSVDVTASYNDGINNTRSDNNSWDVSQVDVTHSPTFAGFDWDGFTYSGDVTVTISNNGSESVTVNLDIVGEDAEEFSFSGSSTRTISGGSSTQTVISYSSGPAPANDSATFRSVVDGNVEATTSLFGTRS